MFALFNKLEKYDNRIKNITTNEEILDSLSDIGLNRSNNEDSVVTLIHPNNQNLKLLAVADGVGGRESGEVASNFTISVLEKWFYNLPEETINNTKTLINFLTCRLHCISPIVIAVTGIAKIMIGKKYLSAYGISVNAYNNILISTAKNK